MFKRSISTLAAAIAILACGLALATTAHAGIVQRDNVVTMPAGHPRGIVMLIHGGAFVFTGPSTLLTTEAAWWNAHGYIAYDVDYRGGVESLTDVVAAYDRIHEATNGAAICVSGDSAGGTLALLLAIERPSVACVITQGAIADQDTMPASFRDEMVTVLPGHLHQFSPVDYAAKLTVPVLMGGSTADTTVPESAQLGEMKSARPRTHTMLLAGAPTPDAFDTNFTHANVTAAALARFHRDELRLVASSI